MLDIFNLNFYKVNETTPHSLWIQNRTVKFSAYTTYEEYEMREQLSVKMIVQRIWNLTCELQKTKNYTNSYIVLKR